MRKSTDNTVRVEAWNVTVPKTKEFPEGKRAVAKVAVRDSKGRFHGATNFKGSVLLNK